MTDRLTVDPELIARISELPVPRMDDPTAARHNADSSREGSLATAIPAGVEIDVVTLADCGLTLRVLRRLAGPRPRAVVLDIHGGGFVAGTAAFDDALNAILVERLGVTVVCVDYRLAPEHPYPAGLDDCTRGLEFAHTLSGDAPVIVYGDSAGGNLAAGLALRDRDRACSGHGIDALVLIEPVLDARALVDGLETPSMRQATDTLIWDFPNARRSWRHYLAELASEPTKVPIYASPALAADLSGLPPTLIIANQADPLLDEDLDFARRLALTNVDVEAHLVPRACHGLLGFIGADLAERARGWVIDFIDRHCLKN